MGETERAAVMAEIDREVVALCATDLSESLGASIGLVPIEPGRVGDVGAGRIVIGPWIESPAWTQRHVLLLHDDGGATLLSGWLHHDERDPGEPSADAIELDATAVRWLRDTLAGEGR